MRARGRPKLLVIALFVVAVLLSSTSSAWADDITISLTTVVSGLAGSSITVFGNLTNNTSGTLYFSDDAINLASPIGVATAADDLIVNGLLGLEPTAINANSTLDNVDLFTISLLGVPGTYAGNLFDLIGGTDPVACSVGTVGCDTNLGSTQFSFDITSPTPAPEPSTLLLLASGFAILGFLRRKNFCHDRTHDVG